MSELSDELRASIQKDCPRESMELPDFSIKSLSCSFCTDCGVSGDAMYSFTHTIDDVHDHIIPMGVW
jgi:hypothetical protein